MSYKPNSVYKNDISNWSSDIKLKSSDFIDKKNEEKKSIVKKETQKMQNHLKISIGKIEICVKILNTKNYVPKF